MVDLDLHLIKDSVKYVDDPVKLRNTILILIDHINRDEEDIKNRSAKPCPMCGCVRHDEFRPEIDKPTVIKYERTS